MDCPNKSGNDTMNLLQPMKDPLDDKPKAEKPERPKPLHEFEEVPAPIRKVLGGLDRLAHGPAKHRMSRAERHYAGFHDRLFANVIDFFLIFMFLTPVFAEINAAIYGDLSADEIISTTATLSKHDQAAAQEYVQTSGLISSMFKTYFAQSVILGFIYVFFWSHFSATPGKLLIGMRIVDKETEKPLTMGDAIARYLAFFVSLPPLMLGFLWLNFHKKHQAWHDSLAGTVVIYSEKSFLQNIGAGLRWMKQKLWPSQK